MSVETVRKSVPLTSDEAAALDAARTEGTAIHDALTELAGPGAVRSDATALQAILHLGLNALQDRVSEQGYKALAAAGTDEDRDFHQAMRARRRVRGDGE
jgi:hypothetical protein